MTDEPASAPQSVLPYVIPMAGFLAITTLEGYLPLVAGQPNPTWYPILYAVKVAVVTALVWACRSTWRDLVPLPGLKSLALAIVIGLTIAALWVGLDGYYPELPFLGKRTSFDPGVLS